MEESTSKSNSNTIARGSPSSGLSSPRVQPESSFDLSLRRKRLMTLAHLFLMHRYQAGSVHNLNPTEDNRHQTERMKALGIFGDVYTEGGLMITADVQGRRIGELLNPDRVALRHLIDKRSA
jgi:isocitrate/methylisocitrate lyase